ncbi:S-layer homology domain-containing protein [Paenibacillus physcomitrellae]|uniref:Alpha-tubulin suppressor n=1 Tax=Paenibacillus physcomitrellae TaxID=1619311 RepID=A0ABQ1GKL2_9BACL|nr:S-layer homology domain-containing protein [Paenibacillus physcomitrellae]GGA45532.1 hypothetical protein GCM10010917_33560 [Paenibacillus physcomitrellae]
MRRWMQTAVRAALAIMLTIQDGGLLTPGPVSAAAAAEAPTAPQLKAGYYHSVSLISSGTVYTWGQDSYGQLGNNSTVSGIASPVMVKKLTGIVDVDSGVRSSMALKQDGTVWMWGGNMNGQLGIGSTANSSVPVQVPGLRSISAISGGVGYHSMALTSDGTVWTWGKNDSGELGDGTQIQRDTPVQVAGLTDVKAIAAGGYFSLALKNDGTVWAWGVNENGELGDGSGQDQYTPVQVSGLSGVQSIAAGGSFALALKEDGTVWTWGENKYAQLGDGTRTNRTTPVQASNLEHITAIAGGGYHSLALDDNGNVWGWGDNSQGQLGQGNKTLTTRPLQVAGITGVKLIAAGGFHSLAMRKDGVVWGWGLNTSGQLGTGNAESQLAPVQTRAVLDTTPPDTGGGLPAASDLSEDAMTISWPAATDNLLNQEELQYQLYWSEWSDLDTVSLVENNGTPVGDYAENQLFRRVSGLTPGMPYYFYVIVRDGAGLKSVYNVLEASISMPAIYTVTYAGNGNTEGEAPVDGALYAQGAQLIVPGNSGGLAKTGSVFGGWNTEPDGSGIHYAPGDQLTIGTDNMILYAQWVPVSGAETLTAESFSPLNKADGVPVDTDITLTFNQPVSGVSGKKVVVKQVADGQTAAELDAGDSAQVQISDAIVTFHIPHSLAFETAYYIEIEPGAFTNAEGKDYDGMQGVDGWSFTTATGDMDPGGPGTGPFDTALSSLSLRTVSGPVRLAPAFDRNRYDYSAEAAFAAAAVTIAGEVYDNRVSVTASVYNGSGSEEPAAGPVGMVPGVPSPAFPLAVGANRIELTVAAPDTSVSKYTIFLTRAAESSPDQPPVVLPPSGGDPVPERSAPQPPPIAEPQDVQVLLNGSQTPELGGVASSSTAEVDGRTVANVKLDAIKLQGVLSTLGTAENPDVAIASLQAADQFRFELPEALLATLRSSPGGTMELKTPFGGLQIPFSELGALGPDNLQEEAEGSAEGGVTVLLSRSGQDTLERMRGAAGQAGLALMGEPLDIAVQISDRSGAAELSGFGTYVALEIPLLAGDAADGATGWNKTNSPADPTAAVILQPDGSLFPVPVFISGDTAQISSLSTGSFMLVQKRVEFSDVPAGHFAEKAVYDLASRLIMQGYQVNEPIAGLSEGADQFEPGQPVTRAEFAQVIVRALGLAGEAPQSPSFADVEPGAWYAAATDLAQQYGILQGYADGTYRPENVLTRQEAMAIIARSMKLAGVEIKAEAQELNGFADGKLVSAWAQPAAAALVKAGIIAGNGSELQPFDPITRGELAVMIRRLLIQTSLINGDD